MTEQEARQLVVKEARSWLGTPFHLGARIKGPQGGIDCFTIMAESFHNCGLTPPWEAEFYHGDWWCHDTRNGYLRTILKYARQVPAGCIDRRPANLVLARRLVGPTHEIASDWHGGIITTWPMVVHAYGRGVTEDSAVLHPAYQTSGGLVFFNPFATMELG